MMLKLIRRGGGRIGRSLMSTNPQWVTPHRTTSGSILGNDRTRKYNKHDGDPYPSECQGSDYDERTKTVRRRRHTPPHPRRPPKCWRLRNTPPHPRWPPKLSQKKEEQQAIVQFEQTPPGTQHSANYRPESKSLCMGDYNNSHLR